MPDAPIRVLLVEDNPADAAVVRLALAESLHVQFQVQVVASLVDAFKLIATDCFEVVLLGLSLLGGTALETVDRLGASNPGTPVVVLGKRDDLEFISRGLIKFGAQDYLVKGEFDSRLLARSLLTNAIERKRIEQELATGARRCAGGVEAERGLSGHDEPRDPHPDERDHRDDRDAARYEA